MHTGYLPDADSFVSTDLILRKYLRISRKTTSRWHMSKQSILKQANNAHTESEKYGEIWKDMYSIIKGMGSIWETSKILNGLPEESEDIGHIMANGGASQQHYKRSRREISWLEENGKVSHFGARPPACGHNKRMQNSHKISNCFLQRSMHGQHQGRRQ